MFQAKRGPRASSRRRFVFHLGGERLEERALMAQAAPIDLLNIASGTRGTSAYGVAETGVIPLSGAGWTVTDVGDVNGSGYDSFVVAAPKITTNTGTGEPQLAPTGANTGPNTSTVYLIFGSEYVNANNVVPALVNYLTATANQRVGNLSSVTVSGATYGGLGTATQVNPTNVTATIPYQFNGIAFTVGSGSNINWQLGASVTNLGDINGDGFSDFIIGAPGAPSATGNNPGSGRAYLIYGGTPLSNSGLTTVSLDNPTAAPTPVVTFETNQLNAALGYSAADGLFLTDNTALDLALGAPGANSSAGEVIMLAQTAIPSATTTVNIDTVGQTGSALPGFVFTGATAGDQAGWSLAGVGNLSHSTTNANQSDLLIGAPQNGLLSGVGAPNGIAYLVDAEPTATFTKLASTTGGITSISLTQVSATVTNATTGVTTIATNAVPGAIFTTSPSAGNQGYQIGYSVAAAGIINGGQSLMIGAPIWDQVFLMTNQGNTRPNGIIYLDQLSATGTGVQPTIYIPTIPTYTIFQGGTAGASGDLVGFSETAVGSHSGASGINDIAIGSPGWNNGNGRVYWISSTNAFSRQVYILPNAVGTPYTGPGTGLFGAIIQQSVSSITNASSTTIPPLVSTTPAFLGASVSGLVLGSGRTHTTDSDTIGDLIIGAPGFSLANYPLVSPYSTTTRTYAGAAYVLEGALIPFSGGGATSSTTPTTTTPVTGVTATLAQPGTTIFIPPIGSSLVPTIASLSAYDSYVPLSYPVAYAQFKPSQGWLLRMLVFSGRISQSDPNIQRHVSAIAGHSSSKVDTLEEGVFTRDSYHDQKVVKVTHKVAVIPADRKSNVYQH